MSLATGVFTMGTPFTGNSSSLTGGGMGRGGTSIGQPVTIDEVNFMNSQFAKNTGNTWMKPYSIDQNGRLIYTDPTTQNPNQNPNPNQNTDNTSKKPEPITYAKGTPPTGPNSSPLPLAPTPGGPVVSP